MRSLSKVERMRLDLTIVSRCPRDLMPLAQLESQALRESYSIGLLDYMPPSRRRAARMLSAMRAFRAACMPPAVLQGS